MQVHNIKDAASSVTLGAQETVAFTMTDDTSMLMMLSTNLYSNPELAVIREVLCNAWDAHAEAGIKDKAIRITITADNDLIVQDFGNGIPHASMKEIYGTYGKSTKKDNPNVTGGFGLGCKSPFAIVTSFRVNNENKGIKAVWQMTRADVSLDGKPGMTKVIEVPTEGSGLTVSFRLPAASIEQIKTYIRFVVMHGEMNAEVKYSMLDNYYKLPVLGMSEEPGSFSLDDNWYDSYMGNHRVFVRYGAVVYPMLDNPATTKQIQLITEFMRIVGYDRLLVQAAPNTLSLAPSREALSSVPKTVNGLTDLCVKLVQNMEDDIISQIPGSVQKLKEKLEAGKIYSDLTTSRRGLTAKCTSHTSYLKPEFVASYINSSLGAKHRAKVHSTLNQAYNTGLNKIFKFENKAATKAITAMRKHSVYHNNLPANKPTSFIKKFIFKPLARTVIANQALNMSRVRLFCTDGSWENEKYTNEFVKALQGDLFWRFESLQLLVDKPVVFLTKVMKNVQESVSDYFKEEEFKNYNIMPAWVYHLKPKDDVEAIVKHFESAQNGKFTVVNLTLNHSWDTVAQASLKAKANKPAKPVSTKPVVKKVNTLATLADVVSKTEHGYLLNFKDTQGMVVDNPTWFIEQSDFNYAGGICYLTHIKDMSLERMQQTVVVRTGVERNMAIKRGATHLGSVLAKELFETVTSKDYQTYITKHRQKAISTEYNVSSKDLKFMRKLGIKLTGYDKLYFNPTFERIKESCGYGLVTRTINEHYELNASQKDELLEARKLKLEKLPFIQKLQALYEDPILGRFEGLDDVSAFMDQYPERASALKSLVLGALKTGKKSDE